MGTDLIQIVDAAMSEAVRRSGAWIACKPGCAECCLGPFPISVSDAARLRSGMDELERTDPHRAAAVRRRAAAGPPADEDPCPALDPATRTCDLYLWRPLTCRMFGPAVRSGGAIGVCGLCYEGATEEEIDACAVTLEFEEDTEETTIQEALCRTRGDGASW